MLFFCCIYNAYFRYLVKQHELGVGKDLSGNADFVLADPPYNVQRDRNEDDERCGLFRSNDMKDMGKLFGAIMTHGAHGHLFFSALQCSA